MENDIKSFTREGLIELMASLGQPSFRGKQLFQWLYRHSAVSYDQMTNLPESLRTELTNRYPLRSGHVVNRQVSQDGTRKYVIEFHDGARVETVAMPTHATQDSHAVYSSERSSQGDEDRSSPDREIEGRADRLSVCFSTQAGCSMGCAFCATGKEGLTRNLTPGEMIDQIAIVNHDFDQRVSNLVAMGQGEPFLNYDSTLAALRIANSPDAFAIGARHITLSTCGIVQGIERLATEPEQFTLAVSLHAALQPTRDVLMPAMASTPLPRLKTALNHYCEATNRRVTFEYLMIDGVNDTPEDLHALIDFCKGMLCHVNLLPMNAIEDSPYRPSSKAAMRKWVAALEARGIETTIRRSRGSDIAGACGQLKNSL